MNTRTRGDRTPTPDVPYVPYVEPDHGPDCRCLGCCSDDVFDPHEEKSATSE